MPVGPIIMAVWVGGFVVDVLGVVRETDSLLVGRGEIVGTPGLDVVLSEADADGWWRVVDDVVEVVVACEPRMPEIRSLSKSLLVVDVAVIVVVGAPVEVEERCVVTVEFVNSLLIGRGK